MKTFIAGVCRQAATGLSFALLLSLTSLAQVTTDQVIIGGLDAKGSANNNNPPTLAGGLPVSATIDYSYDTTTKKLTVVVTNTTPVTGGAFGPIITRVFLNIPSLAVTGMSLHSASTTTGALTGWSAAFDTNLENGSNLNASSFGGFGIRLKTNNGINKGIKNAAETQVANSNVVAGPVTFVFNVTGPGAAMLTAHAFANSQSGGSCPVNAAMHFQGGGMCGNLSAFISNAPGCSAGGWIFGDPRPGNTLFFVETAAPGCFGCLICSVNPGPTMAFGLVAPVGEPYTIVLSAQFPNGSAANVSLPQAILVPSDLAFVGVTFYCAVVIIDASTINNPTPAGFDISPGFTVTVLPPLP